MKYRAYVEKTGAFRRYSRWYSSPEEVLEHLSQFLLAHQGLTYTVALESGEPSATDIGF